ncbi:MAG: ACT domain-containing protein [Acidobacteriota bacterium]
MKKWFTLSAIAQDRPGMVADLAEFIYECNCNLEDSSMSQLGSQFAVLLLLSSTSEEAGSRLSAGAKRLEWEKQFTVFIRTLEREPMRSKPYGVTSYRVETSGLDKAGIVARVARVLAQQDASICDMTTEVLPAVQSGTPVYHMSMEVDVPNRVSEATLRRLLEEVAASLQIEVILKRKT